MTDVSAQSAALANLDRVYKSSKIDIVTYQREKDAIEKRVTSIFDDQATCTIDLANTLRMIPTGKSITHRIMCTRASHYASGFIDSGYGCGYRNAQMLLSSIREDPALRDVLFNGGQTHMPSITKIQELIEAAWAKGFDLMGKNQLGGKLKNSAKWIGASDLAAMFLSLKIRFLFF
jgi:L-lysine 2,3-aminomutase